MKFKLEGVNHLEWEIFGGHVGQVPKEQYVVIDSMTCEMFEHGIYNAVQEYNENMEDVSIYEDVDIRNTEGESYGVHVLEFDVSMIDDFNLEHFLQYLREKANNEMGPFMIAPVYYEDGIYGYALELISI